MKAQKLVLAITVSLFSYTVTLAQCGDHSKMKTDSTTMKTDGKTVYSCSMHPEVISDKPGDCPKCGMKLTEKKSEMKMDKMNFNGIKK